MKWFALVSVFLVPLVVSQEGDDVVFKSPVDEADVDTRGVGDDVNQSDVNTRNEGDGVVEEGEVGTRFFNVGGFDVNNFAGQVGTSALGTIIGNGAVNLAGNVLGNCRGRRKRSILMHKLEKRQALEGNEKEGNPDAEPEVATRFFCPGGGGGTAHNSGRFCDRCRCSRDWECRRDCRKCGNNGYDSNFGWSSNSGNNNAGQTSGWSSNSGNNNYGQPSGWNGNSGSSNNYGQNNYGNNNNGAHSHGNKVNCNTCYCSNYSCKQTCRRCVNNNGNNNYNSGNSGWSNNNGGSYNNGWRRSGSENEQTGKDMEDRGEIEGFFDAQPSIEQKAENNEGGVVFA